ncbi:MAG: NUDIX hydrolase [Cyanobacteria bacterium J06629_2]
MNDKRTMITFDRDRECFNYRVAGIAINNNRVLLHTTEKDNFWSFPGGRVEMGEASERALIRELKEELNENIEVIRLLWMVENFFVYAQKNYHEICFYYLMQFPERSPYLGKNASFSGVENDLEFQWFATEAHVLAKLPLLPSFLQNSLGNLPVSVQHLVHRDRQLFS